MRRPNIDDHRPWGERWSLMWQRVVDRWSTTTRGLRTRRGRTGRATPSPIRRPEADRPRVRSEERAPVADSAAKAISIPTAPASEKAAPAASVPAPGASAPTSPAAPGVLPVAEARERLREAVRRRREYRRSLGRHHRRRLRLGGGWIVALSIVALLILSVGVSVSPAVAVRTITVTGVSGMQRAEAQKALASLKGQPLPQIGTETIRARLDNSPWVQSFTFAAVLPHELSVHLTARTPVGVFASGKWFLLVDAAGVAISKTTSAPAGYPILATPDTDPGSAAFAAAVKVSRSLDTGLRATVQRISASSSDDVTLLIEGGVDVVWGDASQTTQKAAVLAALRKAVPDAKHLDVSSPKAPVSS